MYSPVDTRNFYETDAGLEVCEMIDKAAELSRRMNSGSVDDSGFLIAGYPYHLYLQEVKDATAAYLTGNYSEETETHTLYRGIKGPAVEDFIATGRLRSRLHQYFEGPDGKLLGEYIDPSTHGSIPAHAKSSISKAMGIALSERPDIAGHQEVRILNNVLNDEFITGIYLFDDRDNYHDYDARGIFDYEVARFRTLTDFAGIERYKSLVDFACADMVPPRVEGVTLDGVLHPTVHTSSSAEFIAKELTGASSPNSALFSHVVKIEFVPGSIPIAPLTGITDEGQLIQTGNGYCISVRDGENEWNAYGQIPQGNGVNLTLYTGDEFLRYASG